MSKKLDLSTLFFGTKRDGDITMMQSVHMMRSKYDNNSILYFDDPIYIDMLQRNLTLYCDDSKPLPSLITSLEDFPTSINNIKPLSKYYNGSEKEVNQRQAIKIAKQTVDAYIADPEKNYAGESDKMQF